jgi:hypothetical protein
LSGVSLPHPEQRQPEKFIGAEFQRRFRQHRRDQREKENADQRAERGGCRRQAHGEARLALPGQRIAVHRRGRIGRRAGNIEQNGSSAAAIDGAEIDTHQRQDGLLGHHLVGHGHQERHAHGGGQAGQQADRQPQQGRPDDVEQ